MSLADDVKERLDIVEVVGQYVPNLLKAGRNFKALCPFHSEKTPSFVVFPDRQTWRCFGACAIGGDAFAFVMRKEQMGFSDALKMLAQRAGVTIPQRPTRQEDESLYRTNEAAAAMFQELLHSQRGSTALTYLESRGLDREATEQFQLGLSPGGGDELLKHLAAASFSQQQVVAAGLATSRENGPPRDMFRGRLMFPIHDERGRLAGFGGRTLNSGEPKYLNSPRTPAFDKSHILYAFHRAKEGIKESGEGVVVEGYMDAIAAHQHGFRNVVASMGTALTEAQVRLLLGTGQRFVLALDPDPAGQAATFRSLQSSWQRFQHRVAVSRRGVTFYEKPFEVTLSVAVLPEGEDPDQVIRQDPTVWKRLIQDAPALPEYLLEKAASWWDLSTDEGKSQANEQLFPFFASMTNVFERERYLRRLADLLGVAPETLAASVSKPQRRSSQRDAPLGPPQTLIAPFEGERRDPLEEHLMGYILQWPDLKKLASGLPPEALRRPDSRELFTRWLKCSTIEELVLSVDEALKDHIELLLSAPFPAAEHRQREQAVEQCVHRLEERRLRELKAEEALLLSQSTPTDGEEGGEPQDMDALEQRVVDTNERLRQLFYDRAQTQQRG